MAGTNAESDGSFLKKSHFEAIEAAPGIVYTVLFAICDGTGSGAALVEASLGRMLTMLPTTEATIVPPPTEFEPDLTALAVVEIDVVVDDDGPAALTETETETPIDGTSVVGSDGSTLAGKMLVRS